MANSINTSIKVANSTDTLNTMTNSGRRQHQFHLQTPVLANQLK
jgi:hypothetical protein